MGRAEARQAAKVRWGWLNVECMQRAGVRDHFTIHRYCPCQRALNLQIALKPVWCIHCVVASYFFKYSILDFLI
jgi:hypothetical protein